MALKVFLKHPWYDPAGLYRRTQDNPHIVDFKLEELPSSAEVEDTAGKKQPAWELRGETDPALRAQEELDKAEMRKAGLLADALRTKPTPEPKTK